MLELFVLLYDARAFLIIIWLEHHSLLFFGSSCLHYSWFGYGYLYYYWFGSNNNESALEYINRSIAKADAIPIRQNVSVGQIYSTKGAPFCMMMGNHIYKWMTDNRISIGMERQKSPY